MAGIIPKQIFFLLPLIFISIYTPAQEKKIIISGTILDSATRLPVEGASIIVSKTNNGTTSNSKGKFHFQITDLQDDLHISHLGYQTVSMRSPSVKDTRDLVIMLKPQSEVLDEISFTHRSAERVIARAIQKIPDNYINHPHISKGFYRTYIKKEDGFLELSEAVFDIYNYGYASAAENRLRLLKMRAVKDEQATKNLEIGMNPKGIFDFDIIKNINDHDIIGKKGIRKHDFRVEEIVDYNGRPAFEISFDQKDGLKESLYKGKFYIDTASYAFLEFDYMMSPKGIKYSKFGSAATRLLMNVMDIHISSKGSSRIIKYRYAGDKLLLSAVSMRGKLKFQSTRNNYDYLANVHIDYVVTQADTTEKPPFTNEETLGNNHLIENQNTGMAGNFWTDYNIILPEFNVDTVVEVLKDKNARYSIKEKAAGLMRRHSKDPAKRLDTLLSFYNNNGQFNGSALISHKGKIILNKGYGYSNIEQRIPADSNTIYRTGSGSKSFTALLIYQLVNEGKIKIEAPVKNYIPWYIHGDITIEQLLTHQSGIPNLTNSESGLAKIFNKEYTLRELVLHFCSDSLEFKPGSNFRYSNSGYILLALLAEEITGTSYHKLVKARIFEPLNMVNSFSGSNTDSLMNTAKGYLYGSPEPVYPIANVTGSGGISSTTKDLLNYVNSYHNASLLSKTNIEDMFMPRAEYKDWQAHYAYGWMIDRSMFSASQKHKIVYHPGTDMGFYSMIIMQEDSDIVIILLNNTGEFPRYDLADLILDELN